MKTQTKALVVGSMTAFVGILSPAAGADSGTCYAVTQFDATTTFDGTSPLIVRYLAKNEGSINSDAEVQEFHHLQQQAYSLVGKGAALFNRNGDQCEADACPPAEPNENTGPNGDREQFRVMTTLDGTIITGEENNNNSHSPDAPGAHMGLDVQFVRIVNGTFPIDSIAPDTIPPFAIGPITLECTSTEFNATPESWVCNVKAEFQEKFVSPVFALTLPITLEKVDPGQVEACSVFQDTGGALPIGGTPEPPTTTLPTTTLPTTTLPTTPTTTLPTTTTTTLPTPG